MKLRFITLKNNKIINKGETENQNKKLNRSIHAPPPSTPFWLPQPPSTAILVPRHSWSLRDPPNMTAMPYPSFDHTSAFQPLLSESHRLWTICPHCRSNTASSTWQPSPSAMFSGLIFFALLFHKYCTFYFIFDYAMCFVRFPRERESEMGKMMEIVFWCICVVLCHLFFSFIISFDLQRVQIPIAW